MLRFPGLSRVNNILLFSILISVVLYFGRELFILVTFSGFLAMLMTPLSNRFEKKGVPRLLTALISIIIIIAVIALLVMLLSAQILSVAQDIPKIRSEVSELVSSVQLWISRVMNINVENQVSSLKDHASEAIGSTGSFLAGFVKGSFTVIGEALLMLVFTFLFLLHREKYENFVVMLYRQEKRKEARSMIEKVSRISEHYLAGRIIAIFIIAILNIIGIVIIGLKNGVLLASIAALMAIIPYVGPLLGGVVPVSMALIDGSFNQAIEVIIVVLIVNAIDHYFIEPYVVGGSVNISPLFTIVILIAGYIIWGIAGVILFLPMLGILKIVCENVEGLHPYAYLIGDNDKKTPNVSLIGKIRSIFKKGESKSEDIDFPGRYVESETEDKD